MTDAALTGALIAEAVRKSDLLWVDVGGGPARAMWHVWHDGAALLVTGGIEQPDPGLAPGGTARLVVRSRDKGGRLVTLDTAVERVDPAAADWPDLAAALLAKRLNSPDGDAAVDRWRAECTLWQLTPTGVIHESPGSMSDTSHRAEVPESPATSNTWQPFHLGKATHVRR